MDTKTAILLRKTRLLMEARGIRNAWVGGSNPSCGTIESLIVRATTRRQLRGYVGTDVPDFAIFSPLTWSAWTVGRA